MLLLLLLTPQVILGINGDSCSSLSVVGYFGDNMTRMEHWSNFGLILA